MTKKVSFKWHNRAGDPVNVYGQATQRGDYVSVWTRDASLGLYKIERFGERGLTAGTLKNVLMGGKS